MRPLKPNRYQVQSIERLRAAGILRDPEFCRSWTVIGSTPLDPSSPRNGFAVVAGGAREASLEGCTAPLVPVDPSRRPIRGLLRVTVRDRRRAGSRLVPQQLVDACLGAGALVDALDDDGA